MACGDKGPLRIADKETVVCRHALYPVCGGAEQGASEGWVGLVLKCAGAFPCAEAEHMCRDYCHAG